MSEEKVKIMESLQIERSDEKEDERDPGDRDQRFRTRLDRPETGPETAGEKEAGNVGMIGAQRFPRRTGIRADGFDFVGNVGTTGARRFPQGPGASVLEV
jgi:hypothetical protein